MNTCSNVLTQQTLIHAHKYVRDTNLLFSCLFILSHLSSEPYVSPACQLSHRQYCLKKKKMQKRQNVKEKIAKYQLPLIRILVKSSGSLLF